MERIENDCCGCAVPAYPCIGNSCPLRNARHYYCDKCGNETILYHWDDRQLCAECVIEQLDVVEGSEF
jgi:ribosomal protein S27AE